MNGLLVRTAFQDLKSWLGIAIFVCHVVCTLQSNIKAERLFLRQIIHIETVSELLAPEPAGSDDGVVDFG